MTQVINIKDLVSAPKLVIVDADDVRHELKTVSVGDFIANLRLIENMGTNTSAEAEMEAMIEIVLRGFPTLTDEKVRAFPLEALERISELARGHSGEVATTDEQAASEAEASGNDQPAT